MRYNANETPAASLSPSPSLWSATRTGGCEGEVGVGTAGRVVVIDRRVKEVVDAVKKHHPRILGSLMVSRALLK